MAIITDPDNLDRWQVCADPVGTSPTIALKALGSDVIAKRTDGQALAQATSNFVSATGGFTAGVDVGDILVVAGKTDIATTGVIGFYTVDAKVDDTTLTVSPQPGSADTGLTFKIVEPTPQTPPASIEDGATLQCIYSFLKEEWQTLSDSDMPDLIKFVFPLESITREQFEIGGTTHGNWDWKDTDTRNLIRTAGWMHRESDGLRKSDFPGIITLGAADADAQVTYQQVDEDENPVNFVLTGPVNQSIQSYGDATHGNFDRTTYLKLRLRKRARSYDEKVLDDIGVTAIETIVNRFPLSHAEDPAITATDGEIQGTEAAANKYQYAGPTAIDSGSDGGTEDLNEDGKIGEFSSVTGSFDTDLSVGDILELEDGSHIGYFEIVKIHSSTVLYVDTSTSGAWTSQTNCAWKTWTRVRAEEQTDGSLQTKFFTSVSLQFVNSTSKIVRTTGSFITDGYKAQGYVTIDGTVSNDGTYLVGSVSALELVVVATLSDEGPLSCDHSPDIEGTLTSALSDFVTDAVAAGDILLATDATTAAYEGAYKVVSVTDLNNLVINTIDQPWPATAEGSATFHVLKPGMHLQTKEVTSTPGSAVNLTFAAAGKTITRASGSWLTDNYRAGGIVNVTSGSANNLGEKIIESVDSATQITVLDTLIDEGPVSCNWTGYYGFKRQFSTTGNFYPFKWRCFGNGGTLQESFQYIQRRLRDYPMESRTGDIDDASTVARGDITDFLMIFSTPTGTTLNVFVDNLASTDYNNATYTDSTDETRNFPFLTSIAITISQTLIDDPDAIVKVFWTDSPNQFGTAGAVLVQDKDGADMEASNPSASPIEFTYDYDATQNGHGGGSDEDFTIVAIGTDIAQYIKTSGAVTQKNENAFSLQAALERNYSNP